MALRIDHRVVGPFQQNSYLLWCDDTHEAVFVDPGAEPRRLAEMCAALSVRPTAIWLTHAHIDHVGAAASLQDQYGIPLFCPAGDREWIDELPLQARMFGFGQVAAPRIDGDLPDGAALQVGHVRGRVVSTPGHTAGGVCLYFADDQTLVTGDTLFVDSVGRTDLPGGDFPTLESSVRRLYALPDDVVFHPGHGPAGTLGHEKRHNPFVRPAPGGRGGGHAM